MINHLPPPPAEGSTYSSPQMFERRRRILREARNLLVERGLEGFTLRDLCQRADVAQRTIYNVFGGKERVMATAIRQHHAHFIGLVNHVHPADGLDGVIEQLILTHQRNLDIKNYVRAVVALYYSPTAAPEIRGAMRQIGIDVLTPWLHGLKAAGKLKRGVAFDELIENLTNVQYMILAGWCLGEIPDDRFVFRMVEALLLMAAGAAKGAALAEITGRLNDLHGERAWFDGAVADARTALAAAGIGRPRNPSPLAGEGGARPRSGWEDEGSR